MISFIEVFIIFVMVVIILMYLQNHYGEVDYMTSNADGRKYLVRNLADANQAADMLASINIDLVRLVRHMDAKYSNDKALGSFVKALANNYNPNSLSEGSPDSGYTSMTINKGEKLILCIRNTDKQFVEKNVVMYVAIHELAHIMTYNETGHTQLFWDNFKILLREAVDIGVYLKRDYQSKPVDYCGIKITSSVI
jgi:hypothetical protein